MPSSTYELLNKVSYLHEQGTPIREIADNLTVTPQWVRDLVQVSKLIKQSPILQEFIIEDKLAVSTCLSAYGKYGDSFLASLDTVSKQAELSNSKITPVIIEKSLALKRIKGNSKDDSVLRDALNEYYGLEEDRARGRKLELKVGGVEAENNQTLKNFWHNLTPRIDNQRNLVDLGTVDLNTYMQINEIVKSL